MIILNRTTKRHPSPLGDFTTHRWSGNALWSIGQRSIEESPTLYRGKADAPLCIFGTPNSEAMESSTAKAYGIGFAELPKLELMN